MKRNNGTAKYKVVFSQDNRLFTRYYADDNSANLGINKQISYGAKLISTHLLDN